VSPALAADLAPAPVEPVAPLALPFDWTGLYVGVNAGYALGGGDATLVTNGLPPLPAPAFPPGLPPFPGVPSGFPGDLGNVSTDGVLGGVQAGYNIQFGTWVVGVEGDIDYFNGDDEQSLVWPLGTDRVEAEYSWLATVRARAGYAMDNFLIYVTGGVAVADVEMTYEFERAAGSDSLSESSTSVGWVAGIGAEYAFTRNWSVKVEGLYADLGSESFEIRQEVLPPFYGAPPLTGEGEVEHNLTIFRAGVNYRF
jgi:outer membrane immunogenic protein